MGVLSQIVADEKIIFSAAQSTSKKKISTVPVEPCRKHQPPYGRHFWRDSFGTWRCTECFPPAALAMVREQTLVESNPEGAATSDSFRISPGLVIMAIDTPGQQVLFSPAISARDRREVVESFAWFDRTDQRRVGTGKHSNGN